MVLFSFVCVHVSLLFRFLFLSFCCACIVFNVVSSSFFPPHLHEVSVPLYWCRHSFPHRCIFPSRRRFCITDGARQCPLLVLIYYSLFSRSSNNEVGCKSKMVDVFSYHNFSYLGRISLIMIHYVLYKDVQMEFTAIHLYNVLLYQYMWQILLQLGIRI